MQIRIFTVDENGFIKIRSEDFARLLNDAYSEGRNKNSFIIDFQEPPKDVNCPTWWEFLQAYSVTGANIPDSTVIYKLKNWRIPADLARLDIKLKEK